MSAILAIDEGATGVTALVVKADERARHRPRRSGRRGQ
jgi:hypothetical protein